MTFTDSSSISMLLSTASWQRDILDQQNGSTSDMNQFISGEYQRVWINKWFHHWHPKADLVKAWCQNAFYAYDLKHVHNKIP